MKQSQRIVAAGVVTLAGLAVGVPCVWAESSGALLIGQGAAVSASSPSSSSGSTAAATVDVDGQAIAFGDGRFWRTVKGRVRGWFRDEENGAPSEDELVAPEATPIAPTTVSPASADSWPASSRLQAARPLQLPDDEERLVQFIVTNNRTWDDYRARQLTRWIVESGLKEGVDPRLVASVIATESSFRLHVISSSGAIGLGQLLPTTARWLQVSDPFDPIDNVAGISRYLRFLQDTFGGDREKMIASYYVGQGTVQRQGIPSKAQPYIQRVDSFYGKLAR